MSVNNTSVPEDCYQRFYEDTAIRWTFLIILLTFMLLTLIGNSLVCLALIVDRSLRTPANIFLVNMSVGDIFVTGTIIFTDIAYLLHFPTWRLGSFGNWVYNIGFIALLIIPFSTLVAVTCDRYLSILHPFRYIQLVTKEKAGICVAVIWIYTGIVISLISLFVFQKNVSDSEWQFMLPMNGYYLGLLLFHTFIPLIIIILLYSRIYTVARRHSRQINTLGARFGDKAKGLNVRLMKAHLKATRTILIVVIVLAFSWLPFIVNETVTLSFRYDSCTIKHLSAVTNYVTYLNGAVNPFVYSLRHRRFFLVFKKMICCTRDYRAARNVVPSMSA
ncbi:octopamine receptor 1-like [Dendronephthya gigantea]|uniref:octopamine receptor 1-like n=1 Tax=Dendronephthya gigantea TaxID=151771 RepID=UPI00106C0E17|nr:octopamine receptor 1-like [Dendronephthya gigantea]